MEFKLKQLSVSLLAIGLLCGMNSQIMAADAEAEFKKAVSARDDGDLADSIVIFQSILSEEPSLHRARLELAVAYYRSTQFDEAEKHAQKVLDDPSTPATVRLSIIAFLAKIKSERKRFTAVKSTFRPSVSVGFLHDTNVNVGPSSSAIDIGTQTLRINAGSEPQSDSAFTASVGLNHSYQTGKIVKVGGRSAAVLWQSQAALYTKQYEDLSEFNLDVVSLSTGPAFIVPKHWRGKVSLRLDNIELGSDRLALYTSLLPSSTWQLNNSTELTVDASFVDRDYKQTSDEARDSFYKSIGVSMGKRYSNAKVSVQAGLNFFDEDADNDRFSRDGFKASVGASWKAWKEGAIYTKFSQRETKHDAPEPGFGVKRDERSQEFVLGFRHKFGGKYLDKWVVNGKYSNTDNNSNVDLYTYDREVTSVTLSRSF